MISLRTGPSGHAARSAQAERVQRYYDVNTRAFARYGQGAQTLRRAVWGPGVATRAAAFRHIDALILQEIRASRARHDEPYRVLDLGCGLCSSLIYLAAHAPVHGLGVTISPVQAQRAQQAINAAGLGQRVQCIQADFMSLPVAPVAAQLVFSIEAFVHAASPVEYFEAAARQLAPSGRLIVCDDVLASRALGPLTSSEARCLAAFRDGWHATALSSEPELIAAAERAGFRLDSSLDLTHHLELRRPRDRLLRACLPLLSRLPIAPERLRSLMGGDALQRALASRLIEYKYTTWSLRA
jgi:cyclopropane fatty-acyl-phospholipid synthase-like methyltransferase